MLQALSYYIYFSYLYNGLEFYVILNKHMTEKCTHTYYCVICQLGLFNRKIEKLTSNKGLMVCRMYKNIFKLEIEF